MANTTSEPGGAEASRAEQAVDGTSETATPDLIPTQSDQLWVEPTDMPHVSSRKQQQPRARRLSGKWIATIAVGIVGFASVAVGSATPTSSDRRSTADNGGLKKVWSIPSSGSDDVPIGRWLIGTLLVRTSSKGGVRAYHTADGSAAYRISQGASESVPCAMSTTVSPNDTNTVVAYR